MKNFLKELNKVIREPGLSKSVQVVSEKAVINNLGIFNINIKNTAPNILASGFNSNSSLRLKRTFEEKHNDNNFLELVTVRDDSYYSQDNVDYNKDKILDDLSTLKTILENEIVLQNSNFLSKEIALFYTSEVSHTGENRGKVYNKKCEMYSDKFKENSEKFKNLDAYTLSDPIEFESKYKSNVILHSKLKTANCDSYKHAHEIVVAKQISSECGTEIFISGDCPEDDPELKAWIGDLPIQKYDSEYGQMNPDIFQKVITENGTLMVIRGGDIKHRALPKLLANKQLGINPNSHDIYITPGTAEIEQEKQIVSTISKNLLTLKYKEYADFLQNPNTSKEDLANLAKEIKDIQKYQSKADLENINNVEGAIKIVFNNSNIKLNFSESETVISPILYDEVD